MQLNMINNEHLTSTLMDLLKIDSPAKNERAVADYLKRYFSDIGYTLEEDNVGGKIDGNTGNLYLFIPGDKEKEPVAFLSHMDTVSSTRNLSPLIKDSKVVSNGETILGGDNKAGIAVMCELARHLKETKTKHCPIELIFTVSEEIGLLGIKNIDCKKIKSKFTFVLDAGGPAGTIVSKAPSLERIYISIKGRSAHAGAEPEKGINAIAIAAKALSGIKQGRVNQESTLNFGKIHGGEATNIVPEHVYIEGEARSYDNIKLSAIVNNVKDEFGAAANEFGGGLDFTHRLSFSTFSLDSESKPIKAAVNAAKDLGIEHKITHTGGGSDANVLNQNGIASVGFGIGVFNAHTNREYISLQDLYNSLKWVIKIVSNPV